MHFLGDPTDGPTWDAEYWRVNFTPDGSLDLIQDEQYGSYVLKGTVIDAILRNDTPVIMAVTFVLSCLVILFNLLADVIYAWLDPRISYR